MMAKYQLHKQDTLKEAVTALFLSLSATIRNNRPDDLSAGDTEQLHDYRVAIRRTRCLLGQFKQVFHNRAASQFRDEFIWLFGVTGTVRDIDVHLADLQHYKNLLPTTTENDLAWLNGHLLAQQKMAYSEMLAVFDSQRYEKLLANWHNFLKAPHSIKPKFADTTIFHFANKRIRANHLAILKSGGGINPDTPDEIFHDLRKNCKKLRYLIEFFGGFYEGNDTEALLKALKNLQDNLGSHQDLCVQIQFLQQLPVEKQTTWELLIGILQAEKQKQRVEFKGHFDGFTQCRMPSPKN